MSQIAPNKFIKLETSSHDYIKQKLKSNQIIGKYLAKQQRLEQKTNFQKANFRLGDDFSSKCWCRKSSFS